MIENSKTSYDIYNPDYDETLIVKAQEGDQEARTELFFVFKPMIKAIAKKKSSGMPKEQEDLYSYLSLEFLLALQDFKGEKGEKFSCYLTARLSYKSSRIYKGHKVIEENEEHIMDDDMLMGHTEDGYEAVVKNEIIAAVLSYLGAEEKVLIQDRFVRKMTYRAMGAKYGISHVAMAKRMDKLLTKIHDQLAEAGFEF